MKKLLVALLALVSLAVVAAGCGGGDKRQTTVLTKGNP